MIFMLLVSFYTTPIFKEYFKNHVETHKEKISYLVYVLVKVI